MKLSINNHHFKTRSHGTRTKVSASCFWSVFLVRSFGRNSPTNGFRSHLSPTAACPDSVLTSELFPCSLLSHTRPPAPTKD